MQTYDFPRPVYTKEFSKDVPERLLDHHWQRTADFNKLPKIQLKVRMCCAKCEEKVLEEIWEVPGVFDVRAHWMENKVVVTAAIGVDEYAVVDEYVVLRKARKIDCKARFVELDPKERPPPPKPTSHSSQQQPTQNRPPPQQPAQNQPPPQQPPQYLPPPPEYLPLLPQRYVTYEPNYTHSASQDGMTSFYFLFLVLLLVSMYVFRR